MITACKIYTVPHTMIDGHRSYVLLWLLGVVGTDLHSDRHWRSGLVRNTTVATSNSRSHPDVVDP
jgi:hypothetical protein